MITSEAKYNNRGKGLRSDNDTWEEYISDDGCISADNRREIVKYAHNLGHILQMDVSERMARKTNYVLAKNTGWARRSYESTLKDFYEQKRSEIDLTIESAIESSRSILDLKDDWDEEGSPGYTKENWQRATQFVRNTFTQFKNQFEGLLDAPEITPGPDGSIDVRWKTSQRSVLINFPADLNSPPDYFGSDKGIDTVKGTLNLSSSNDWLLIWLKR